MTMTNNLTKMFMITVMLVSAIYRPPSVIQRQKNIRRNVVAHSDIVESSRILGQGITAGVLFYTTLQWAYYRSIRIETEKTTEEERKKNEKKNDK